MVSSLLAEVNEPQRAAITHEAGPLLVLAGPGSGKTLVLTRRLAWLTQQGVDPDRILAITFTNKAAGEMRERVERLSGYAGRWISTFHSFGARILRIHADRLGYDPRFTIFDDQDQRALVRHCVAELGYDAQSLTPAGVSSAISNRKSARTAPAEAMELGRSARDRQVAEVYRLYEEELRRQNAFDFDDLLGKLLDLLEQDEEVREKLRDRFQQVLVDEYQDTNRVQFEIAALLAEGHRNLCVTGDPDQSIYRWRGADIRNILDFERRFPDTTIVRLEQNYRSTRRVLQAASSVIAHNMRRKAKDLWSENEEGPPVRVVRCRDARDEGTAVVARILELYGAGHPYSEMAVLYRTNAQSRSLEQAFRDRGIPYAILGGVEFFRRREIKDLLAYLRAVANPQDDVSLERILNVPPRRIGSTTVARLRDFARERGLSLRDAVSRHREIETLRGVGKAGVARFADLMERLDASPRSVERTLDAVVDQVDFLTFLRAEGGRRSTDDRVENVRELLTAAAEYDRQSPDGGVEGFLETVALVSDTDAYDPSSAHVTLMTLHSAKGLEFDVVFVTGLEEGLLPHQLSREDPDGLEEERRLLFVGITRSRRELMLSHARWRGRFGSRGPAVASRFLEELPGGVQEVHRDVDLFAPAPESFDPLVDEDPSRQLRPGAMVRHERFGLGRVVSIRGRSREPRVVVSFRDGGRKEISLAYGRLDVVEEWS
jgi:DNA helicase-2/ATP-dependent DNA helicase PcrA